MPPKQMQQFKDNCPGGQIQPLNPQMGSKLTDTVYVIKPIYRIIES